MKHAFCASIVTTLLLASAASAGEYNMDLKNTVSGFVAAPANLANCQAILDSNPAATSGVYSIDPDGSGGGEAFDVRCDMTTDGGGWTVFARGTPAEIYADLLSDAGDVTSGVYSLDLARFGTMAVSELRLQDVANPETYWAAGAVATTTGDLDQGGHTPVTSWSASYTWSSRSIGSVNLATNFRGFWQNSSYMAAAMASSSVYAIYGSSTQTSGVPVEFAFR